MQRIGREPTAEPSVGAFEQTEPGPASASNYKETLLHYPSQGTLSELGHRARRTLVLACMALVVSAGLTLSGPGTTAKAYATFGWRWESTAVTWSLYCTNCQNALPSWYSGHVGHASSAWSGLPTPITLNGPTNSGNIIVQSYSADDNAGGHGGCASTDGYGFCVSGQGYANYNFWSSYANRQDRPVYDKYTAMHEFGHALGLAHSQAYAVMAYDCYSETNCPQAPTQDDIDGLNAVYPTSHPRQCSDDTQRNIPRPPLPNLPAPKVALPDLYQVEGVPTSAAGKVTQTWAYHNKVAPLLSKLLPSTVPTSCYD
jgi:hypothetical protein